MTKRNVKNQRKGVRKAFNAVGKGFVNTFRNDGSRKTLSYLSNFVAGIKPVRYIAGKSLETTLGSSAGYDIGNPVGSIIYGGLDIVRGVYPEIKSSKYLRLTEAAGTAYYGLSTIADLFGILSGDFGQVAKLPLDVAMLFEVGRNTAKDYRETKSTIKGDLKNVKKDCYDVANYVRGILSNDYFHGKNLKKKREIVSEDYFNKKSVEETQNIQTPTNKEKISDTRNYSEEINQGDIFPEESKISLSDRESKELGLEKKVSTSYFSIPYEDGSFNIEHGKDFQEDLTFYKVEQENDNSKGKLFYVSGDFDKRAIDNIDFYLKPVCDIENLSLNNSSKKRVKPLNSGEVFLNEGKWKINPDKKVKVRLVESLEEKAHEIFYLSTPNKDGSFNLSSVRDSYIDGASIYQFTKISDDRAKFRINENLNSVKLALKFPDVNIESACEAQNGYSKNVRNVITESEGEAVLERDKWIIVEPAKIRYE